MKLPEEMIRELYKIKDDLSGDERSIVEAIVRDCAEEAHYEAGPGLGPIVERHLLARYGLDPK